MLSVFLISMCCCYYFRGWWLVCWSLCFSCFLSIFMWHKMGPQYNIELPFFFFDYFNVYLISLTFFISFSSILASSRSIHTHGSYSYFFLLCLVILCGVLVSSFMSSNFLSFFYYFESSLIPIFWLILGWGVQPERLSAVKYMGIYMMLASIPLWLVLSDLNESGVSLYFYTPIVTSSGSEIWWICCVVVFLVKLPVYPFHLWLPKAHVEAPVSGSMMLAGVMLKLGAYGIIRLMMLFHYTVKISLLVMLVIVLWGGFLCCCLCWRQVDIKSCIAYASIGHMALVFGGLVANSIIGWKSAYLMCLAHGICSSALFYLANCFYEMYSTRKILLMKGSLITFPSISFFFFFFLCCNFGFPPSLNWLAEILIYHSILSISSMFSFFLVLISFFTSLYSIHLYSALNHGSVSGYSLRSLVYGEYLYWLVLTLHLIFILFGSFFIK